MFLLCLGSEFFVEYAPPSAEEETAGVSKVQVGGGNAVDTLSLLLTDKTIDLWLFVDNTMTEAFFMGGEEPFLALLLVTNPTNSHHHPSS